MDLINTTSLPAELFVSQTSNPALRGGMLIAKATFNLDALGRAQLATQSPEPLLTRDTPSGDLGCMPAEMVPRDDDAFEVILLGACHAPGSQPTPRHQVVMRVGTRQKHLVVTGDRAWQGSGPHARVTAPVPFTRMPLTYERAFGGCGELMLDPDSPYPVLHPMNARGRGFDPGDYLAGCAAAIDCPPGFPSLVPKLRLLPNLEDPEHLIRRWSDAPEPACWATIPADAGFLGQAIAARTAALGSGASFADQAQANFLRAHPEWTFERPPATGSEVSVFGVTPHGGFGFALPKLHIVADFAIGAKQGILDFKPQSLVILPEKRQFYLTYRAFFRYESALRQVRSFRLRLLEGWNDRPQAGK